MVILRQQTVIHHSPEEMQSLSVLCAQPLGLENAGDMSAGDLRSWEIPGAGGAHDHRGKSTGIDWGIDWEMTGGYFTIFFLGLPNRQIHSELMRVAAMGPEKNSASLFSV